MRRQCGKIGGANPEGGRVTGTKTKAHSATIISSKRVFAGRVFTVRREHIVEPGGLEATREIIMHPGSVVVLPVFPDGRILLIRQYRHAAGQSLWELVAGRKDEGETFLQAANRELKEETGYTGRWMKKLMVMFPSPGFLTEQMVLYLAEGLQKGQARPEDDEKITSRIFTLAEIEQWIRSGKIRDAKTIAGILYYARYVARGSRR
jgi:ADP-ribose pyrophosphatase